MKPAAVINQGDDWVTLRATTDRPAEIQEALAARDVQQVFKGDQNQAWDAVLANHCLARAVGDSGAEITFFVQDERLGTSDARLSRIWRQEERKYVPTEDYYRGRAGAVWEHQDVSYGLFYTEAVSPEQFARTAVHLHRTAVLWERHAERARRDGAWVRALAALGVHLPAGGGPSADAVTRLGPAVHPSGLAEVAVDFPAAELYYALTKTDGLYGLVPVGSDNIILSSIPANDPELRAGGAWLLVHVAARGAMRLARTAAQRRGIKLRARKLAEWAGGYLERNPDASVAELQAEFGRFLTGEIFPADRIELDLASHFTRVDTETLRVLNDPERSLHFFLDLALRHPREFTEAYNEALNRVGFGLQRIKYDPASGRYTPPFFVELAPGGAGRPVYRYGIELTGVECTTVTLQNPTSGDIVFETGAPVRSAADFMQALLRHLEHPDRLSIIGKAATFAAELQRAPRGLGLPRQGSKYAPMVDHLIAGLRARGVLDQPTGLLIRIGLNALDRLEAMGELPLRLPRFLTGELGRETTCRELALGWRRAATSAHELLELLSHCHFGQHVHLVKLLCLNAAGEDVLAAAAGDHRLRKVVDHLRCLPEGDRLLRELGRDVPPEVVAVLRELTARREELLRERRRDPSGFPEEACREREELECKLLLLFASYVRRLWQRAESLPYLNDRPYTLALYLLFGTAIFPPICRQVEFDVEYISPVPVGRPAEPQMARVP